MPSPTRKSSDSATLAPAESAPEISDADTLAAADSVVQPISEKDALGIAAKGDDEKTELQADSKEGELQALSEAAESTFNALGEDIDRVSSFVAQLTEEQSLEILRTAIEYHKDDINFASATMEKITKLAQGLEFYEGDYDTYSLELRTEAALIGHYSPYPEVRAVTDPFDDPTVYVETPRVYLLALIWTIIGAGIYQFFASRQPSIALNSAVIQLFLYPSGKLLAFVLPDYRFSLGGRTFALNPGPWSYKEQMLCTLMCNVAVNGAYVALYNIITEKMPQFYNNQWVTYGYQFLLIFSTQFLGFGFAGVLRRWVIYPTKAIWPTVLPTIALSRALLRPEKQESVHGWTISRYWFFLIATTGSFVWFWFPGYLFQALSTFNWMTWIAPSNFNLAVVTGSIFGLGYNPIGSFDVNLIIGSNTGLYPFSVPFWSALNQYSGSVISGLIILCLYFKNYKWTGYMPINDNALYTNTGDTFRVTEVLTNGLLDQEKYQNYSPPYYTASNLMVYGSFFALYPLAFVHTMLHEGKHIYNSLKTFALEVFKKDKRPIYEAYDDPHSRMMRNYREVPDWWFLIVLVVSLVLSIVCIKIYPTNTPVWALFVIILVNFVFLIPLTIIYSTTGFSFGLNVLCELIVGYALPGNGQALMILKAFGYNIDGQAESYISDQKMAHYSKLPPRAVFRGQLFTTLVQCLVSIGVVNWQIGNVEDFCSPTNAQRFTCPGPRTYYSASVMWGVIGPKRMFNGLYPILQWCFLIGALVPLPFYFLTRRYPRLRKVNPILICGGMLVWAPYNLTYYTPGIITSFCFMYVIKTRYIGWWEKYNYVLSSALTAGVAFSAVILFFAVQFHPKPLVWWGNLVPFVGVDGGIGRQALLDLPESGYFGLDPGHFP
ncbi:OPT oligopeptide transporter protein-domain-containing protein [Dipodascopsis tothii]|uniref:OPT oligopeptide transporter protein-domain-containing protein n=1 Tax=Dipodascopsis tothii TaxID=44089 RepID=UPI0034CF7C49